MTTIVTIVLGGNAVVAFGTFFVFQFILIVRLKHMSNPGMGIGDANSFHANLSKFTNGQLWPDLQRKWVLSVYWVGMSFAALFVFAFLSGN